MRHIFLSIALIVVLMSGCAKKQPPTKPADVWLKEGLTLFEKKDYEEAAESFENAIKEAETPEQAARAQRLLGDSYFEMENFEEAIPSYQEYLSIYTDSKDAPKVLHRIGLSYYKQLEAVDRDQTNTELALESFDRLRIDYPDYAEKLKLDGTVNELRHLLAQKEMYIVKFYFRINEDEAAEYHLKRFLKNHRESSLYPQAALMLGKYMFDHDGREAEGVKILSDLLDRCHNPKMMKKISSLLDKYASKEAK